LRVSIRIATHRHLPPF